MNELIRQAAELRAAIVLIRSVNDRNAPSSAFAWAKLYRAEKYLLAQEDIVTAQLSAYFEPEVTA